MEVSCETFRFVLERELPRKLKDAWIECGVDPAKVGGVDVQRIRHGEIGVVENVERLKPQFNTQSFFEPDPLYERGIDVPVTWSIDRRQAQLTYLAGARVGK